MRYVTYYRVSTKNQGGDGLGIQSQKDSVKNFLRPRDEVIEEFIEVESGRKVNRQELLKAIELCKETKATLLIAKLDRLARNAQFVLSLRDSGVKFKCVDNPEANNLTIGLLAILAQDEVERISDRTTKALSVIKDKISKGIPHYSKTGRLVTKLGNNNLTDEARVKAIESVKRKAKENKNNKLAKAFIQLMLQTTEDLNEIVSALNENGFKTSRGKTFSRTQVKRLC